MRLYFNEEPIQVLKRLLQYAEEICNDEREVLLAVSMDTGADPRAIAKQAGRYELADMLRNNLQYMIQSRQVFDATSADEE